MGFCLPCGLRKWHLKVRKKKGTQSAHDGQIARCSPHLFMVWPFSSCFIYLHTIFSNSGTLSLLLHPSRRQLAIWSFGHNIGIGLQLTSSRERPVILLNILWRTKQPHSKELSGPKCQFLKIILFIRIGFHHFQNTFILIILLIPTRSLWSRNEFLSNYGHGHCGLKRI